jgi:PII-like signaling protein
MNGYQLTFFTQQDRKHAGKPLADWLVQLAREMNLRGATLVPATEGYGHARRVHSVHFFELADQPLEVVLAVTEEESERLFERLRSEGVRVFYVKTPIEFGTLGVDD